MKKISRVFLFSALTLMLLLSACAADEGTPTAGGTVFPNETATEAPATEAPAATDSTLTAGTETTSTATITETAETTPTTDTTLTPSTPVTGADVILLECQFCIEGMGNALLVFPDTATFEVVNDSASLSTPGPDTGCNMVDTFGGRQVVLCRGEENTTLTLNICTDGTNCTQLEVELQSCPDTGTAQPGPTDTPGAGVPTNTPTPAAGATATDTPGAGVATATPTP
jgi:hypothetical protein